MSDDREIKKEIKAAYDTIRLQQPWCHKNSSMIHHRILPYATLAPWLNDIEFINIYDKVKSYTLVDLYRCYELWVLAEQTKKVSGAILEVGVWRGGTGVILAEAAKRAGKRVFLADTFRGVVKAGAKDTAYKGGEHSDTSKELVSGLLYSLSLEDVILLDGVFPEQTEHFVQERIAMLHCDVDVYSSAKDVAEWCLPRMGAGPILVFDDYGFYGCEGVTMLCNELRMREDLMFTHNLNGHAVFFKIS